MNPAWTAEWLIAIRRRRLLALNALVPLLLVTPVALAAPPAAHAAGVYTVLFVLFGVFGSAIPLVRDGASGLLGRWRLAGMPARELLAGRIAAQTGLDVLEALPAALVVVVASGRPGATLAPVLFALPFALLVANAVGAWTAAAARSLAEGALFSSVLALLLLHAAGTFRTPAPGSLGEALERASPFRVLHEAFLMAAGGPAPDPGAGTLALWVGMAALMLTAVAAPLLVGRLATSSEG